MGNHTSTCILCKNRSEFVEVSQRVRDSDKHHVLRCKSCNHVQIWPIPSDQENRDFYDKNKQPKNLGIKIELTKLRERQSHDTKHRIRLLTKMIPHGSSVLEVGSSYGFLLEELCKSGYKAHGVELSKERCSLAKQVTKTKVFNIDLIKEKIPGHYDAVVMTHVLEHISDPVEFCAHLRRYLKKEGCLIAEVPNLDDLMLVSSSPYKSFWWQLAHLSYFNEGTLQHVFRQAGYRHIKIIGVQRYGIDNMMSWLVSGKPQIESPTYETNGPYQWFEKYYKSYLEKNKKCDTLIAVVTP